MKSATHLEAELLDIGGNASSGAQGIRGRVKPGEETVAGGIYLMTVESLELAADGSAERADELAPAPVPHLGGDTRRLDDVDKHDGRHAAMAFAPCHAAEYGIR